MACQQLEPRETRGCVTFHPYPWRGRISFVDPETSGRKVVQSWSLSFINTQLQYITGYTAYSTENWHPTIPQQQSFGLLSTLHTPPTRPFQPCLNSFLDTCYTTRKTVRSSQSKTLEETSQPQYSFQIHINHHVIHPMATHPNLLRNHLGQGHIRYRCRNR